MHTSISCRELGIDCDFVKEGETEEIVIGSIMSHVQTDHTEDWFEIEEIHQAAWVLARKKVA